MIEKLLIVNDKDEIMREGTREECHSGKGILHQGYLVALYNDEGKILVAKRKESKLWGDYWDGSVAGHVYPGEDYESGAIRRVKEEVGIQVSDLEYVTKYQFQEQFTKDSAENEMCALFKVRINEEEINANSEEIEEYRFVSPEEAKNLDKITPWFKIALDYL